MLFNSLQFLFFFVIVTGWYYVFPKIRWQLLLVASCYFYMVFQPVYLLILLFTILVDYVAGIYIEKSSGRRRFSLLCASLVANIGILAVFKYYPFLFDNVNSIAAWWGSPNPLPVWSVLLPIGLSFHTFQAMSYTIEVYRGNQRAERHLGIYALYVLFYPQLVAGPIERPQNLLPQFHATQAFCSNNLKAGLWLMVRGFFKKVVIADRLAVVVNAVYGDISQQNGLSLLLATLFFAFQIYCDFSGYSDIAIGAAKTMGFKLMTNFNAPYLAHSISDFWKRWHISLSTWFRDYLYLPLGGNRVNSKMRWYANLMTVFLVSGLWHGAKWTFVVWGFLHGTFLIIENMAAQYLPFRVPKPIQYLLTLSAVCGAWVFFRANSLNDALLIFHKISNVSLSNSLQINYNNYELAFCFLLIGGLLVCEKYFANQQAYLLHNTLFVPLITLMFLICYWFGIFESQQFIYFQF